MQMQDDSSAIMSLLSSQMDNGKSWVETARVELRRSLACGRLSEGEEIGALVGNVLRAQENGAEDELSENQVHRESLISVVEGIKAALNRNSDEGIRYFRRTLDAVYANESLRWVAWLWIARTASEAGDFEQAVAAGSGALELAEKLDKQASSTSLCVLGELEARAGNVDQATIHLGAARDLFTELEDTHGVAMVELALARVAFLGDDTEGAIDAAIRAQEADSSWIDPVLFLADQALIGGDLEYAQDVLAPLLEEGSDDPGVLRTIALVRLLEREEVPADVLSQYVQLKELPPSEEVLERLTQLAQRAPEFDQLGEAVAWALLKLGHSEQAQRKFSGLAERELDSEVHASVLLGLGCLASHANRDKPDGARLHAAAAAWAAPEGPKKPVLASGEMPVRELADSIESLELSDDEFEEMLVSDDGPEVDLHATADAIRVDTLRAAEGLSSLDSELDRALGAGAAKPPSLPNTDSPPLNKVRSSPTKAPDALAEKVSLNKVHLQKGNNAQGHEEAPSVMESSAGGREASRRPSSEVATVARSVFSGSLQLLAVPDLLDFLKTSRRTGTLVITSNAGIGAVQLKGGNLTGVASPSAPNLGDLLVNKEVLTREQLTASGSESNSSDRPVGCRPR